MAVGEDVDSMLEAEEEREFQAYKKTSCHNRGWKHSSDEG